MEKNNVLEQTIVDMVDGVEEGQLNPLEVYVSLKKLEDALSAAMKQIKDSALDEAQKHSAKEFVFAGAKIQVKNAAGKWDYANVSAWNHAKEQIKSIEEQAKQAYKMKAPLINGDTGEVIEPAQYTEGATTLAISFKNIQSA
jgi:hypothetical protein